MDIYKELGNALVKIYKDESLNDEYNWKKTVDNMIYGFKHMRNYGGKMAQPKNEKAFNGKPKLGLFDFKVKTESKRYNVTHRETMINLLNYSTLTNCENIWYGRDPEEYANSLEEYQTLITLALLMFEQEINWGDEIFQRNTFFSPHKNARPRDMLMGFIRMFFMMDNINSYPFWIENKSTPTFPNGNYNNLDKEMKEFFEHYKSINLNRNPPLIYGESRNYMNKLAANANDNERYLLNKGPKHGCS
ncbi:hypothetical protein COJ27_29640 [Bacillus cereus]|uniref:hypothetical protein n=1 Tax=Bacillus cereus TaxID=1396 RepID=UPI000BF36609|nr:hypothetical protein [Bacillus cereus]PFL57176.1 hypothetical protein COJ27_29640 [Bacillus cereus]HDR6315518.1 hypothetical protein [Bacillus thuringiensis]